MTPEPCLNLAQGSRCYSHGACQGFGYCRERNANDPPPLYTTPELIEARRREARERAARQNSPIPNEKDADHG